MNAEVLKFEVTKMRISNRAKMSQKRQSTFLLELSAFTRMFLTVLRYTS